MSVRTGEPVTVDFTSSDPTTGAAANPTVGPTGILVINGTDQGTTVTITNKATGSFKAAIAALPAIAVGDRVQIRVEGTVGGAAGKGIIWEDFGDALVDDARDDIANIQGEVDGLEADLVTIAAYLDTEIGDIRTRVLLALPAVAPAAAGGLPLIGAAQTWALKSLSIVNDAGPAVLAQSTGANGDGIRAIAHGTGSGIRGQGTSGIHGQTLVNDGVGIRGDSSGATNAYGAGFFGAGTRHGLLGQAAGTGSGLSFTSLSGIGAHITGLAQAMWIAATSPTHGTGLVVTGTGTSPAVYTEGGTTAGTGSVHFNVRNATGVGLETSGGANPLSAAIVTQIQAGLATAAALTTLAGKFTGITFLRDWLRSIMRADAADPTGGEIGGTYDATTDSLQAMRDVGMALTVAERNTLVSAIEVGIVDDATGQAVRQAIVDMFLSNLPDIDDLTIAAIRADLERAGGYLALVKAQTDKLTFSPGDVLLNVNVTTWMGEPVFSTLADFGMGLVNTPLVASSMTYIDGHPVGDFIH
jgi:hypothetical protein